MLGNKVTVAKFKISSRGTLLFYERRTLKFRFKGADFATKGIIWFQNLTQCVTQLSIHLYSLKYRSLSVWAVILNSSFSSLSMTSMCVNI